MTTQHTYDWNYFSKLAKKILMPLLILSIALSLGCGKEESNVNMKVKNGVLNGVFYQPQGRDLKISSSEWDRRLKLLKDAGVETIYIQWTKYELCVFEEGDDRLVKDTCSYPLTKIVMKYAKKHKLKVVLGLFSDTNYFTEIQTQNEMFLTEYLSKLRIRYKISAESLAKTFGTSSAFAGWYLPEEIDDLHWNTLNRQVILKEHLDKTYAILNNLKSKSAKVYISSFFSANTTPNYYGKMWSFLTRTSPFVVLVQDTAGITSTPVSAENKILFIQAVSSAIPANKEWGVIFEIFQQDGINFRAARNDKFLTKHQIKALDLKHKPTYKIAFSLRYLFEDNDRLLKEYVRRNQQ